MIEPFSVKISNWLSLRMWPSICCLGFRAETWVEIPALLFHVNYIDDRKRWFTKKDKFLYILLG